MQKRGGWLWVIGTLGYAAAAIAQTPPAQPPITKYDGTYAFVSSTKLNETYFATGTNRIGRCGDLQKVGSLIVRDGHARYNLLNGSVGSHGELTMRAVLSPTIRGSSPGVEIMTSGIIDGNGTVRARRATYYCSYDLTWRKESK
jgi:hypothetical protein